MATEIITRLVDDLDGRKAERTVEFSLDGHSYAIDLSKRNITALQKALQPFIDAARPMTITSATRRTRRPPARNGSRNAKPNVATVRAWAREHGYEISSRGRLSAEVKAAYEAAT
jgi:hypothetical protein